MAVTVAAAALVCLVVGPATSWGATSRSNVAVLPHDTHPGFSVKQFRDDHDEQFKYRLLETGFSQFFTVLENGMVMTTSDLRPLVNQPVNLVVLGEAPNRTATHALRLYVVDRGSLLHFEQDVIEGGQVPENAPAGTRVAHLPVLRVRGEGVAGLPVHYSIVEGNKGGAFALEETYDTDNGTNASHPGVRVVTKKPLDRERTAEYTLTIQAVDDMAIDRALVKVSISVLDENDNSPVFTHKVYRFVMNGAKPSLGSDGLPDNTTSPWKRFSAIGTVAATDADGDRVAYRLAVPSNLVVIVPQTGDLILAGDPPRDATVELTVEAHDLRTPSRPSKAPAQVWVTFNSPDEDDLQSLIEPPHHITKRRVTRAVRPTKKIEFGEVDGETEGRIVFQLEKETEREQFKIRDMNQWVTVEPNGAVRVKKKWDYEELAPEKTIDFWVTITNAGTGGKRNSLITLPQRFESMLQR